MKWSGGFREKFSVAKLISSLKKPLTAEEKKERIFIFTAFLLFSSAAVVTMFDFIWLNKMSDTQVNVSQNQDFAYSEGKQKLNPVNLKYDSYMKYRNDSSQLVLLAEAVGRYPVSVPPPPTISSKEMVMPDIVPLITVKALIVMGGGSAAALDIEGERPGLIMRPGSIFGGGRGKITAIDSKGVSWTWANKKYRTDL